MPADCVWETGRQKTDQRRTGMRLLVVNVLEKNAETKQKEPGMFKESNSF